jgi:hypothetical protein
VTAAAERIRFAFGMKIERLAAVRLMFTPGSSSR